MIGNWSTHVANGVLYSLPYDLQKDFEPISLLATELDLIVARKELPANTLARIVTWLKANADKASGGYQWRWRSLACCCASLPERDRRPFPARPVPRSRSRDSGLLAGRIDMMITGPSVVLPHLRAGTIKVYAATSKTRLETAPDVPTTDEAGLPGFHVAVWQALFAPKGTAPDILARLSVAAREALPIQPCAKGSPTLGSKFLPPLCKGLKRCVHIRLPRSINGGRSSKQPTSRSIRQMPILRQMLGRSPDGPKARVRNFIANARLGTKATTIHENVIGPGVVVPLHTHATEEVIIVLSGEGECRTEDGAQLTAPAMS